MAFPLNSFFPTPRRVAARRDKLPSKEKQTKTIWLGPMINSRKREICIPEHRRLIDVIPECLHSSLPLCARPKVSALVLESRIIPGTDPTKEQNRHPEQDCDQIGETVPPVFAPRVYVRNIIISCRVNTRRAPPKGKPADTRPRSPVAGAGCVRAVCRLAHNRRDRSTYGRLVRVV
ncbi:hypothetical protein EVAR_49544_1 [Eumeta japonica]|uniref:Uncharacterized protein n=1 Tax=Eumeta variegata TaxID=151549 RepID=A0A4C1XHR4_EUMVA|nr:hypothetical protein EVAR_49544_1 [Eumeta japonica]